VGEHFKAKGERNKNRGFPSWHGFTQEKLIQKVAEEGRTLKNRASAYLHGDALISVAPIDYNAGNGTWRVHLFTAPVMADVRVPLLLAISLYADLLVNVNHALALNCTEAMEKLQTHLEVLGIP
jgi:hypothetical protein